MFLRWFCHVCRKKGDSYDIVMVDTEKRYRVLFHIADRPGIN